MPSPLDPELRAAILADIVAGKPRNQIARDHQVSPSSVTRIAQAEGRTDAFDRSETKNATAAHSADMAAGRAALARRYLDKANAFLDQMDEQHLVYAFGGKDNEYNEHLLDRPSTADLRNLMICSATAFDKHVVAVKVDTDSGAAEAIGVLGKFMSGLTEAARQIDKEGNQ